MISITTKSPYALQALAELGRASGDARVPIGELARRRDIPVQFLEQLFAVLRRAGVLKSQRGVKGGYSFARPPSEITVLEVVELLEGELGAEAADAGPPWTEVFLPVPREAVLAALDEALAFYGRLFDFTLRGRGEQNAFIDMGDQFIALAVLLALMVGLMQMALGLFKLGTIVNFVSHPVIIGFTNAAAIIIALSQLNKVLGVAASRSDRFLGDTLEVLRQVSDTHLPSFGMAALALVIMIAIRRWRPRWPGILIAVAVTTVLSWQTGFERSGTASIHAIADDEVRFLAAGFARAFAEDKRDRKESGVGAAQNIPCVNHPVFKDKAVNVDPREAFVRKLLGEWAPHLSDPEVHRTAEVTTRLIVSYAISPPEGDDVEEVSSDLTDFIIRGVGPREAASS